jgi:hypothetical protein
MTEMVNQRPDTLKLLCSDFMPHQESKLSLLVSYFDTMPYEVIEGQIIQVLGQSKRDL